MNVHVSIALQTAIMSTAPLLAVLLLTCGMTGSLVRQSQRWIGDAAESSRRATYTLLLVSVAFFLLCVPHALYETLVTVFQLQGNLKKHWHWLDTLGEVKTFLISLDSAMNFAIYFVMSSTFRAQLLEIFGVKHVAAPNRLAFHTQTDLARRRSATYRSLAMSEL